MIIDFYLTGKTGGIIDFKRDYDVIPNKDCIIVVEATQYKIDNIHFNATSKTSPKVTIFCTEK